MREIQVATAQFEARDGDKRYNLAVIEELSRQAAGRGAQLVVFHECSISGYTFLETLDRSGMFEIAEEVPGGESVHKLRAMAKKLGVVIGAGLVEQEGEKLYNCYALIGPDGLLGKHRKLHAFVSPHLSCGDRYTVIDALGAKIGILICYDNNLPENPRMTAMLGAEIILMPHVTGCLPSPAPGRGVVDPEIWHNRVRDPVRCRMEFDGPKGRGWIMKWLPARAWENGVYVVYANVLGVDGGTIKPGGSMIVDPFGEVVAECRSLADEVVMARLQPENLESASGASYIRARRPELYGKMLEENPALGPDRRPEVYWQKIREKQKC
ncbi:MAG: nitrilase [Acidimicrobiia bacterium]|nr:nitrilase [Acidimicrobiia bacterium]